MACNYRNFCICFYIYLTLVVAEIVKDEAEALKGSNKKRSILQKNAECLNNYYCATRGCINTAFNILKNMDFDVDPCDDFYKFVCDGFVRSTIIPDDQGSVSQIDNIKDIVIENIRSIIEKASSPNEPRPYKLAKDLYKSCIKSHQINIQIKKISILKPVLLDNLKRFGGWPVLEGEHWHERDFNLTDAIYKFRELNYYLDYFINVRVNQSPRHFDKRLLFYYTNRTIYLYPPLAEFPRYYIIEGINGESLQDRYEYMVDIAEFLGADRKRAKVELKEALEFGIMFTNISRNEETDYEDFRYEGIYMKQFSIDYPSIPWSEYLNTILTPRVQLNQDSVVSISGTYVRNLEALISKTPKKVLANYILWRTVNETIEKYIKNDTSQSYTGKQLQWKECVDFVSYHLDLSVGSMYFNKYGGKDVWKIVSDVENEFINILKMAEWMDQKTKATALKKLFNMKSYIMYPSEFLDIKRVNQFYAKLELSRQNFAENKLNVSMFEENNKVKEIEWWKNYGLLTDSRTYNILRKNTILISAAFMEGIYFSKDRPDSNNYGTIGFFIAKEILHGFDTHGRMHDETGEVVAEWWDDETKKKFDNRTQCLIDQYGNYKDEVVGLNVNGTQTLDENIADNAGLKLAYNAYKNWVKLYWQGKKLPGLSYTAEQLFWITFANSLCTKYTSGTLSGLIMHGHQSPSEFRVNGAVSNLKGFAQDFNCKIGSKMNPINKCNVW